MRRSVKHHGAQSNLVKIVVEHESTYGPKRHWRLTPTGRLEKRTNCTYDVHCGLEMPTRRGEGTRIAVTACRRDEGAGRLSLCGYGRKRDGERKRRRDEDRACHWKAP
jgi:hypothetical protein